VDDILAEFKSHPVIKAQRFVGQSGGESGKGMRQKEQIDVIRRFREGEFNTLVAGALQCLALCRPMLFEGCFASMHGGATCMM
jgi:hypothetical protein